MAAPEDLLSTEYGSAYNPTGVTPDAPEETPAPAPVAPTPEELLSGQPNTPGPISPLKDIAQGAQYGLPSQMKSRLRSLAIALGDQKAAEQLAPQPIAAPGVNPESPYFKAGQAGGALVPDVAAMALAPEAAVPGMAAEGLLTGPMEADDLNSYIRAAKAAAPNDPQVQKLQEVDPAVTGLTKAATAVIFAKIAPALSSAGIELPVEWAGGQLGPIGTAGRALQTPVGSFVGKTAANTVGNMAIGDVIERATNPNYRPPGSAADVAQAALPAAAFGGMGALHEGPTLAPRENLAPVKEFGTPPPLPPEAQPTPIQAAKAVPSVLDVRPDLSLQPQTLAATEAAKAATPAPTPQPAPEPAAMSAPPQPTPGEQAERLFPTPEPVPTEPQGARINRLQTELEQTNPTELGKIQVLAQKRDWTDSEILNSLEELADKTRAAQTPPPLEPKSDEQKGSSQESNVRGQAEQQAAGQPDTINQLRESTGNAVAPVSPVEQVREQLPERPGAQEGDLRQRGEGSGLGAQPNAESEERGNGQRGTGSQEQPVLNPAPETPATLAEQQKQLVQGQRPAMLFTPGEKPLVLPRKMNAVKTDSGTYHYNPEKITAKQIRELDAAGRQNELLNLGKMSKAEVLAATRTPVGVVERTPKRTEVRAALATPERATTTAAEMEPQKTPGNTIRIEHPAEVIAGRGVKAEDLLAPRPGSLGTPEGQKAVRSEGEKPSGKRPQKTIEDHEEDLHELNPAALADLQRERVANNWSDKTYERAVKGRAYKEAKAQGQPEPVEQLPTKVSKESEKPAKAQKFKRQTPEEKEASIKATIDDLKAKAKAADKAGDTQGAAQHLADARQYQDILDENAKPQPGTPEKAAVDMKANVPEKKPPALPVGAVQDNADKVNRAVDLFRQAHPDAPPITVLHSDNLKHVLSPSQLEQWHALEMEGNSPTAITTGGKVYLLHDRLGGRSPWELRQILHEETTGHNGIERSLQAAGGLDLYKRTLDQAYNKMVAQKGPLSRAFVKIVGEYKGRDVNPHDIVADDEARRQIMAEVLAHEAGKYQDQDWIQKAHNGLKKALSKIPGVDLTSHDEYMQRLVDAGAKHLKERAQEDWTQKDLTPEQREGIRANRTEYRKTAEDLDDRLPFRRPPTAGVTENDRFTSSRPEDWVASALSDATRTRQTAAPTTKPDGTIDEPAFRREANALYSRAKTLGRDIDFDALSKSNDWIKGGEHLASYVPESKRYLKVTKPGFGGLKPTVYPDGSIHLGQAGLEEYIQRRLAWNKAFKDGIIVHGMTKVKGQPSVVTSQPAHEEIPHPDIMDDPAGHYAWLDGMNKRIDGYFAKNGYTKIGTEGPNGGSYVNPKTGTFLSDTKPGNIVEVQTPQGPRLKFIDGALEQGHDSPVVKRAIQMAAEVKAGLRDPNQSTVPVEHQVSALQNVTMPEASTPSEMAVLHQKLMMAGLPSDIQAELLKRPTKNATQQLSPGERAARARLGQPSVGSLMDEVGTGEPAPVSPSERGRMALAEGDKPNTDFFDQMFRANRAPVAPEEAAKVDRDNQLKYSNLDERITPNAARTVPPGPDQKSASTAEQAASFIAAGDGRRPQSSSGQPETFPERYRGQLRDLVDWAKSSGRVLDPAVVDQPGSVGGGEHQVWHDQATDRMMKATLPGQFGLRIDGKRGGINSLDNATTPGDYMQRIKLMNEMGDDVQLHGIVFRPGETHPSIVTSQPRYDGVDDPAMMKGIKKMLIDRGMKQAGFVKTEDGEYYNPETKTTLIDAYPRNVAINKDGSIIPFDALPSRGDPHVQENSEIQHRNVKDLKVNPFEEDPRGIFNNERAPVGALTSVHEPADLVRANRQPMEQAHEKYLAYGRQIHRRFDEGVQAIRAALPRGLDARDNVAANEGVRAENDVAAFVASNGGDRAKDSKLAVAQRESILPMVEAGFGRVAAGAETYENALANLRIFKQSVDRVLSEPKPTNPPDVDAWQRRQDAATRLQKPTNDALATAESDQAKTVGWSGKVKAEFDAQHGARAAEGLDPRYFDDYAKRILEANPDDNSAYAMPGGGGVAGFDRSQNQSRRFATAYDAMLQGKKLAAMDVAGLVGAGQTDTMKAIGNEQLFDKFRNTAVPGSTDKVIADPRKVWNPLLNGGNGGFETKAPKGDYVAVSGPRGEKLFVNREFAPYFRSLMAGSYVRDNAFLSGLLHTAADLKHGILLFDTFHVGRVMARLANLLGQSDYGRGLKNLDIPAEILQKLGITADAKYGKGRAALDFRPETLDAAKDLGWINEGDKQWALENQKLIPIMERTGFNVAGNLDNLYERAGGHGLLNQVLHEIGTERVKGAPSMSVGKGIETFNKWVFQKMTRNAMTIGWKEAFERNMKLNPGMDQEKVAQKTSREMNAYFGNLGRQGVFKSATAQDVARLVMLAPQWANSMIESQARGVGQLARAPADIAKGRAIGNTAGAMGAGFLAMLAANQMINLITKHQTTFQNEEGHKLDAYIPGGAHGFYLNPASIVAEELHTMMRYQEGGASTAGAMGRIALNKMSPYARAAVAGIGGIDSMGRPIAPGKRGVTTMRSLNPLPIFASGATGDLVNPELAQKGDVQRQLFGMAGLKLDRAQGAGQKLRTMAAQTMPDAFPKNESPGDYAPLRAYVNNDNDSKAKAEILDLLRKGKTLAELNKVFAPKFIGSSAQRQAMFLQKRPDAVSLLQPANQERTESQDKLIKLLQSIPQKDLQDAMSSGLQSTLK